MHTPLIICPDVDTEVRYDLNPTDATDTVLPGEVGRINGVRFIESRPHALVTDVNRGQLFSLVAENNCVTLPYAGNWKIRWANGATTQVQAAAELKVTFLGCHLPRKQAQNKPWYREFSKKPW